MGERGNGGWQIELVREGFCGFVVPFRNHDRITLQSFLDVCRSATLLEDLGMGILRWLRPVRLVCLYSRGAGRVRGWVSVG